MNEDSCFQEEEFGFIKDGTSFLITGATGFIGKEVVRLLYSIMQQRDIVLHIKLAVRNIGKARSMFSDIINELEIIEYNLTDIICCDYDLDYVILLGGMTTRCSKGVFHHSPVEVFWNNINGAFHGLEFVRKNKGIKGVVFASSVSALNSNIICNSVNPALAYGISKRAGEELCRWFNYEYGIPAKVARLFLVYGMEEEIVDANFYADILTSIKKNEDIVLHSSGTSIRNLCDVRDVASALLCICCKGECGQLYDVGSPKNNISIYEIAKKCCCVANSFGREIRIVIDGSENAGKNDQIPNVAPLLDLGWKEMYSDMDNNLKTIIGSYPPRAIHKKGLFDALHLDQIDRRWAA